jgi:hypothetical protein
MLTFHAHAAEIPGCAEGPIRPPRMGFDGALTNLYKNAAFVAFMRGSFSPVVIQPR